MTTNTINREVAGQLYKIATLLEQQQANPFRVNAYRRAARTVDGLDVDLRDLLSKQGMEGLVALPGIGKGIARSIYEIVATGHCSRLENLRGGFDAEQLLRTVPGIGPALAKQLHESLFIDTLEALEIAAHDGRLARLPGMGTRRVQAIQASLANLLGRRVSPVLKTTSLPPVKTLLEVDRSYREKAKAGELPTIAPRRFNPQGEAWMPLMHSTRDHWHFTTLYSNSARAHQLARTHDWVVIYYYDDEHHEYQNTVVTETHGQYKGLRVVRGREAECGEFYTSREDRA